jgi:hypothetical protein
VAKRARNTATPVEAPLKVALRSVLVSEARQSREAAGISACDKLKNRSLLRSTSKISIRGLSHSNIWQFARYRMYG